jgi:hypothetical protein
MVLVSILFMVTASIATVVRTRDWNQIPRADITDNLAAGEFFYFPALNNKI